METIQTVNNEDVDKIRRFVKKYNGYLSIKNDCISINIPNCVKVDELELKTVLGGL